MLDIKFTALLDYLAWWRKRHPEEAKSLAEEELFVPYEKALEGEAGKAEASKTSGPPTLPVEGNDINPHNGPRE